MVRWVNDPDFGWYDADNPLGNVPNLAELPGTDVLRDPTGTYHPDIYADLDAWNQRAMPDPVITMANMGVLGSLPAEFVQNIVAQGTGGPASEAQNFMARVLAKQADPGSITGTGTTTGTGTGTGDGTNGDGTGQGGSGFGLFGMGGGDITRTVFEPYLKGINYNQPVLYKPAPQYTQPDYLAGLRSLFGDII